MERATGRAHVTDRTRAGWRTGRVHVTEDGVAPRLDYLAQLIRVFRLQRVDMPTVLAVMRPFGSMK